MFKVQSMKRFDAGGGNDQKIQVNQFALKRAPIDVKRLKHQLWETMAPILSQHKAANQDVEMKNEQEDAAEDADME